MGTSIYPKLCVTLPRQNAHLPHVNCAYFSVASLDFRIIRSILIFIFVLSFFGIQAQNTFHSEWAIGVSGGVGFSRASFGPIRVKETMLLGLNGGVTVRWITEKNLGLQLEINLKQQGWSEDFSLIEDFPIENPFYTRRMTYVDIPLLTHIYFGSDKVRFFINLGPQIGVFLRESTSENLQGTIIPGKPNDQHTMPVEKKFEWGLGGGPGLEFRSGIGFFLLEGRYYYGLSDFYSTRKVDAFSKASSQIISVKLTYLIPLRK